MQKIAKILIPIVAVVVGVVFVISGISSLKNKDLYDSKVIATVVDIQEEWVNDGEDSHTETRVYIDYEVDGKEYKHVEAPESNAKTKIGDKVEILYQSQNPEMIEGHHITSKSVIFIIVGIVVVIGGIFGTLRGFFKR